MSVGVSWDPGELLQLSRSFKHLSLNLVQGLHSPHKPQPQHFTKQLCLSHVRPTASARLSRGSTVAGSTSSLSPVHPLAGTTPPSLPSCSCLAIPVS